MTRLLVPPFNDYTAICNFVSTLNDHLDKPITLDFSGVGFARPKGMLLLSMVISRLREVNDRVSVTAYEDLTYPMNMGFFTACGLDIPPQHYAPGNNNYIPVEGHKCADIRAEAEKFRENAGETVERLCGHLSGVLTRSYNSESYKVIRYSLREIIRNIVEHSESEDFYVSGQYRPAAGEVELAILDLGLGLRPTLSRNPPLNIDSDYSSLQLALLPGISGKNYPGADIGRRTEWTNSGVGLFMTSQICRMGGEFSIGSGDSAITIANSTKNQLPFFIDGTTVVLRMKVSHLPRTAALLDIVAKRGNKIAKIIGGGANVEASSASKLLMS